MNTGLFESLTGKFSDGAPVESVAQSQQKVRSIMDHLSRLFNCRAGSVSHLPDYGLPDLSELYRATPEGVQRLREAVKRTVEKYEPRLKNVRVELVESKDRNTRISFILSAELIKGPRVQFQTILSTTRPPEVLHYKKPE